MRLQTIGRKIKQIVLGTVLSGATVFVAPMGGCDVAADLTKGSTNTAQAISSPSIDQGAIFKATGYTVIIKHLN